MCDNPQHREQCDTYCPECEPEEYRRAIKRFFGSRLGELYLSRKLWEKAGAGDDSGNPLVDNLPYPSKNEFQVKR